MKKNVKKDLTTYSLHSNIANSNIIGNLGMTKEKGTLVSKDVQDLVDKGFSKWSIAKALGVSWNTVHYWHRGYYSPEGKKREKFSKLYLNWIKRHTTGLTNTEKYVA